MNRRLRASEPNEIESKRRIVLQYLSVIAIVAAAALVRLHLFGALGNRAVFITFFPAVIYSAWVLGWGGGALATVLSMAMVAKVILPTVTGAGVAAPSDEFSLIIFIAAGLAISALGHAQREARRRTEASEARKSAILNVALDAVITVDRQGRITEFNTAAERIFGYARHEAVGCLAEDAIVPAGLRREDCLGFSHYQADGEETIVGRRIEVAARRKDGGEFPVELAVMPMADGAGFAAYLSDITERKQARMEAEGAFRREAILNRVNQAIRITTDSREVQEAALDALAEALNVDRCISIVLDKARDHVSFVAEWRREDLPSLLGEYSLAAFDVDLSELFPASAPLAAPDILNGWFSQKTTEMLTELGIRSFLNVPMSAQGEVVAILGVYMTGATREWTPEEISFVQAVAAQLRSTAEAARLLAEARARADREALVNRIGAAIRSSLDPAAIQKIAVTMLGQALGADRCYFAVYDLANGVVTVANEHHREDLATIRGTHPFVNTKDMFLELYKDAPTSVIADSESSSLSVQTRVNMRNLRLRSRVSVALFDTETSMATLTAAMSDAPRDWTRDEVRLTETVATLIRSAVEMARVQQREHVIAEQLQAALQPKPPARISGINVSLHYKPALAEAGVGGDFYDVFSAGESETYLVVGDLAGKGLAAASQVATVRNMLRFALYNDPVLASAVTSLSRTLSENELLAGFATLFVGRWSPLDRTLTYVNCGQEPGLVRRANGEIVEMAPTGPVLGMYDGAEFEESAVTLSAGDAIAVFTDGLTEVGPTRSQMLGVSGVSALLRGADSPESPETLVSRLIEEVNSYARGGVSDDQCLLIGVIEP